jgi:hypothetical protein
MERNWRRVAVVSVGMYSGNAIAAIARVGLGEGDAAILVNSEPRLTEDLDVRGSRKQPLDAVAEVRDFITRTYAGVEVREAWLDPREPFSVNVAGLRFLIESLSPCRVTVAVA